MHGVDEERNKLFRYTLVLSDIEISDQLGRWGNPACAGAEALQQFGLSGEFLTTSKTLANKGEEVHAEVSVKKWYNISEYTLFGGRIAGAGGTLFCGTGCPCSPGEVCLAVCTTACGNAALEAPVSG
jgi:hypothetical protein